MKKILSLLVLICLAGGMKMYAQNVQHLKMNVDINDGDTVDRGAGLYIYDDKGSGNEGYSHGYDVHCVVRGACDSSDTATTHLAVMITEWNIGKYDTVYIYDGPSITDPLLVKFNESYPPTSFTYYVSSHNTTGYLCVRFRSAVQHADDTATHTGFVLSFDCKKPCEYFTTVIDTMYERLDKDYNVIKQDYMTQFPQTVTDSSYTYNDSVYVDSLHTWVMTDSTLITHTDTVDWIDGVTLCLGQCIRFHGHGEYGNTLGWYTAADTSTYFKWDLGLGDSVVGVKNMVTAQTCSYNRVGCFNVFFRGVDVNECNSSNAPSIQVRVAQNPIKTIYDLATICNNDSLLVNVGYEGDNGTLTLKKIKFAQIVSKTNQVRTFIPDGPRCDVTCYDAPVEFTEFPGRSVQSASDICSICVNYEHSFMGDYSLAILCPTYNASVSPTQGKAYLKYKDQSNIPAGYNAPQGTWGGSGTFTGMPYNGNSHGSYDAACGGNNCDTIYNPFGEGWNYCFSRNAKYTLYTGDACDVTTANAGIASGNTVSYTVTLPPMVSPFCADACTPLPAVTANTVDSSDHANMEKYYLPGDDFSTLSGCPLNGTWNIEVCDNWAIDNGWVFSWSLDICNLSSANGCDYQVGIDSVTWRPDTSRTLTPQYWSEDGRYIGLKINDKWNDTTAAYISSPDTAGNFNIKLSIYDEFGCRWDTITKIATVYTPLPNLGNDTVLCDVNTMKLDATDRYTHTANANYSYVWEPFGDTSGIITTRPNTGASHQYIVKVDNYMSNQHCSARDTINIDVNPQPIPNFDPGRYPLEGCEPLTINIVNTTKNGYKYRWVFGDGTYSTIKNPSHSYAAGTYDFKYYVESDKGCKDSLIYPGLVTVYPQPEAKFSWEPNFPTVEHPTIALHNGTTPDNGDNIYRWEIQYDKDHPYSVHTLTDANPTWTWEPPAGEDAAGSYTVRLISRTENRGPSGKLTVCGDTVENTILIINDNLKFPNVVTPNSDGMNDMFIIDNLVEGLAYPINQLDIYNKWGSRVFHAENITTREQFWDPNQTNSPAGTYFYHFSGKGYQGNIEHNGVIEVIR